MADTREYTIEQLAAAAETMTTTVRMYQARGLLPTPERRGRIAVYGDRHLRRLRHIAELQERGHSLAGIKELLDGIASGRGLTEIVGASAFGSPQPIRLGLTELAARFSSGLTPEIVTRAVGLGLVELDGDQASVDQRFLDVGAELVDLGVPIAIVLEAWERLAVHAAAIAAHFTSLFEVHLWPTLDGDISLEQVDALLTRLGPMAQRVTALALESALADEATNFVAGHGDLT